MFGRHPQVDNPASKLVSYLIVIGLAFGIFALFFDAIDHWLAIMIGQGFGFWSGMKEER